MTKYVEDSITLYNSCISDVSKKILLKFDKDYIKGKKIGLLRGKSDNYLRDLLIKSGAQVTLITWDESDIDSDFIINQNFKADLNRYVREYNVPFKSLEELIDFNHVDMPRRSKYGQELLIETNKVITPDIVRVNSMINKAQSILDKIIMENNFDALCFFDNQGRLLPAVSGYPSITIPLGIFHGIPRGASFIARTHEDEKLINLSYSFEQNTKSRAIPREYIKKP